MGALVSAEHWAFDFFFEQDCRHFTQVFWVAHLFWFWFDILHCEFLSWSDVSRGDFTECALAAFQSRNLFFSLLAFSSGVGEKLFDGASGQFDF